MPNIVINPSDQIVFLTAFAFFVSFASYLTPTLRVKESKTLFIIFPLFLSCFTWTMS